MKVSRRDTIIIAILVNVALLAVLFATANKPDHDVIAYVPVEKKQKEQLTEQDTDRRYIKEKKIFVKAEMDTTPIDEIDQVLHEYAKKAKISPLQEEREKRQSLASTAKKQASSKTTFSSNDTPSQMPKILKANEPTAEPKKQNSQKSQTKTQATTGMQKTGSQNSEPEYYVIKSGDNPWKLARKYNLKFEDLLELNGLDEEKARNLKIGQKIRIK